MATSTRPAPALRVFISYSHKDDVLCDQFFTHLSELRREGLIDPWNDRRIEPGGNWAGAIDEHLKSADITILLVSADFLASDYCNDVEMECAIERNQKRETRVVPVILRPCDWQTSRFGEFQALPKDGKPVVDWRTPDHGFADAVKSLRRMIEEARKPPPVHLQDPGQMVPPVRRHRWPWVAGAAVVLLLAVLFGLWARSQRYLRQGTDMLNVRSYADAQAPLKQARKLNPLSPTANCGLEAIRVDGLRSDKVVFEQGLKEAIREYPRCAYLKVLSGEQKYEEGDLEGALAEYQTAVQREPQLAEAYFRIGRILDRQGKPDDALAPYQTAVQLSRATARYANNLADLYFHREEYDKAIEAYGRIDRYPLAALELAKIYRLQGKLEEAREHEQLAAKWLQDPEVRRDEEYNPWAMDSGALEQVQLLYINEKDCFARTELAMTVFLQKGESQALHAISSAIESCSSDRQQDLKDIFRWELRRLGSQTPALGADCEEITRLLGGA